MIRQLEARRITTHLLFTGNLVRQPAYPEARSRVAALLTNPDFTMNQVFWIGLYPGLGAAEIEYARGGGSRSRLAQPAVTRPT